jgi:putative spermidine/putrescine transport system permease protein
LLYTRLHLGGDLTAAAFGIAVVNLPFMIWSVGAAVGTRGAELEEAAATLGADEAKQFVLVTLPSIAPGIVLGAFMMFIFGITEFTMSVILINAQDATLPMYMFGSLRTSLSTSLAAIGALYIIGCIGFFWLAVRFGHLQQYLFRAAK